jgi:hypothetical protein
MARAENDVGSGSGVRKTRDPVGNRPGKPLDHAPPWRIRFSAIETSDISGILQDTRVHLIELAYIPIDRAIPLYQDPGSILRPHGTARNRRWIEPTGELPAFSRSWRITS